MLPVNINTLSQSLLRELQSKNPQGYQFALTVRQNGGDINSIVKQMLGKISVEQKQQALTTCNNYGAPNDFLSQLQNLK